MTCDGTGYHATIGGYTNLRCRGEHCTRAWREYHATRRVRAARAQWGQAEPLPSDLLPSVGTVRRLQALARIGYGSAQLQPLLGTHAGDIRTVRRGRYERTRRATADAVARIYDQLSGTPAVHPKARRTRLLAERKGWLPPLAWDDDTIDDPAAQPCTGTGVSLVKAPRFDEVAVERIMAGRPPATFTVAERREAVRLLTARGYSAQEIAARIGTTARNAQRDRRATRQAAA